MSSARAVRRQELDADGQAIFDELAATRTVVDGTIGGPFGVLLRSPEAARRTAHLGAYYRYESGLPSPVRHLAAMIVAQAFDCRYEFSVHAARGREDGIADAVVTDLGRGDEPTGLPTAEADVVRFVRQLVATHRVEPDTRAAVEAALGPRGLTDLVGNIGYLMMIACPMNAFEVEVEAGQRDELPFVANPGEDPQP